MSNSTNHVLWLTGLSGAGKSSLAEALQQQLQQKNITCAIIDGDIFRRQHSSDLGFSEQDRDTNIQRMAQQAKQQLTDHQYVIVAAISPLTASRKAAQQIVGENKFVEIFIDTPLAICEQRDVKGLYKKARAGEILQFTGIDSPYQAPINPTIVCQYQDTLQDSVDKIVRYIKKNGIHPC